MPKFAAANLHTFSWKVFVIEVRTFNTLIFINPFRHSLILPLYSPRVLKRLVIVMHLCAVDFHFVFAQTASYIYTLSQTNLYV